MTLLNAAVYLLFVVTIVAGSENTEECTDIIQFLCANDQCIHKAWVCDGDNDCSDNSDEINCTSSCDSNQFQCKTDGKCIPDSWQCDQAVDCQDRSDEANCSTTMVPSSTTIITSTTESDCSGFRCESDAVCIDSSLVCNGYENCADASDEQQCSTTTFTSILTEIASTVPACTGFKCRSDDTCVNSNWVCDNDNDCPDGSDEENCSTPTMTTSTAYACSDTEFQCVSDPSLCIFETWVCDEEPDCPDGTDEENCPTTPSATITTTTATTSTITTLTSTQGSSSPASMCTAGELQCDSDPVKCFYWLWECDGEIDCEDGSDERNCNNTTHAAVSTTSTTIPTSPTSTLPSTSMEVSSTTESVGPQVTSSPNQATNTAGTDKAHHHYRPSQY